MDLGGELGTVKLSNDCHTVGLLTMVSVYQTGQCRLNRMKYGKRMCCLSAMGYSAKKKRWTSQLWIARLFHCILWQ
jgi:hypothetical protein